MTTITLCQRDALGGRCQRQRGHEGPCLLHLTAAVGRWTREHPSDQEYVLSVPGYRTWRVPMRG